MSSASSPLLITLQCPDRTGLVAAVAGALFDLGANLGDTTFAVLGQAADFSALIEVPEGVSAAEVEEALRHLPEIEGGTLSVTPFALGSVHAPNARITHRVLLSGGDRPGLVARLAEIFVQYRANIVRLNAEQVPHGGQGEGRYSLRIALNVPAEGAETCMATVVNTAGGLGLSCAWERAV